MIGNLERILYLKKLPVFARLPNEALAAIAESARERSFPKGALIQAEGQPITKIQLVMDGRVRATRKGALVAGVGPGTPLGSLPLLARDPQGYQGVAEQDTFSLEIEADALLEACEDHFVIVHQILQYLSRWAIEIDRTLLEHGGHEHARPIIRLGTGEMDLVERIFLLRQMSVFAEASINALAELSRGLTEVRFGAGVPLWAAGDASPYVLLVVDGSVLCTPPGGNSFRVGRGHAIGAFEALAEEKRWFAATTATPLIALHGAVEELIDVFEDNHEMAMTYVAALARGVLAAMDKAGAAAQEVLPAP